jgi:hypothetical protein
MINLDNTARVNFDKCEQYYYLRNVRNLVPLEPGSMAPYFGSAIHKGLEHWYKSNRTDRTGAIKAFAEEYAKIFDEKDDERTPGAGMEILNAFFVRWQDDYLRTWTLGGVPQIEIGVGVLLDLSNYGSKSEIYYTGRIDRIVEWETSEGVEVCIDDWKTTYYIGSGFVLPKPNSQFTGYIYNAREITGLPIKSSFIDFIGTKIRKQTIENHKQVKFAVGDPRRVELQRDITERTEEDFEEWKRGLASTVNRITLCQKSEIWPKRTHSCPSFKGCEFIPICSKQDSAKEGVIKTMYKEEVWAPWDETT